MRLRRWLLAAAGLLAAWVVVDFAVAGSHSLRQFDGHAVGRLETAMWRSYYVTEADWRRIGGLLDVSWVSLQTAVSQPR